MKLIFEKSVPGRHCTILPACDVESVSLPAALRRETKPALPEMSETDISRHYTELCKQVHGVNCGFYPLGSCTMKYNPRIDEEMAALPGFTGVHPLSPAEDREGMRQVLDTAAQYLCEITGMDAMTFQPAAGAHGEFTGVLLIKQYHDARGDKKRTKIIVPDSAHGTNPATAAMCGYEVVNIASGEDGCVDLDALRAALGEDTAGLMLTNPNTVGIFDKNILEITRLVHEAGGLCYYDGANLNAVMGVVRPGDMGFDCIHMNLHKTFATPHGGGGPGSGAICVSKTLVPFLPGPRLVETDGKLDWVDNSVDAGGQSIGRMHPFWGQFGVVLRAWAYMKTLGPDLKRASELAVLNANYIKFSLKDLYDLPFPQPSLHECVFTDKKQEEFGVSTMDIAKRLIDCGIHPPTIYFPLVVHGAIMIEPTESENLEDLDAFIEAMRSIAELAETDADLLHASPTRTKVGRVDEVGAARKPVLTGDM